MKEEESGNHGKRKWKVEYVRERERGGQKKRRRRGRREVERKEDDEEEGGRNEEDEEEGGAARDLEMRDVRRDGLIEAFLIAFTPLHGLLYPRYIQYQSYVADPHHIRPWLLLLPPPFLSLSLSFIPPPPPPLPLSSLLHFLHLLFSFVYPVSSTSIFPHPLLFSSEIEFHRFKIQA